MSTGLHAMKAWAAVCCALLTGCSSLPVLDRLTPDEKRWLLSGEVLQADEVPPLDVAAERVLIASEEMRRFAESTTAGHYTEWAKLRSLLKAVVNPAGMALQYDPNATFTAEQAFREKRANCLSFTLMVVALAREVGLPAKFNEVDIPPIWDLQSDDTLVLYKHVNAMFEERSGARQVVDISMEEYDTSFDQRVISDELAEAQYFNNRSMEFLREQRFADALRYLRVALTLEPQVSYFWGNLGSLYRRAGNLRAAELAYRAALEANPADLVAVSNAARLYEDMGRSDLAEKYRKRADAFRTRNPYYRYKLAQEAFLNGNDEGARRHLVDAIAVYPREHRFHFLLGAAYQRLGNRELAVASMNKALELSTDEKQITKYRSKMDRLLSAGL